MKKIRHGNILNSVLLHRYRACVNISLWLFRRNTYNFYGTSSNNGIRYNCGRMEVGRKPEYRHHGDAACT